MSFLSGKVCVVEKYMLPIMETYIFLVFFNSKKTQQRTNG